MDKVRLFFEKAGISRFLSHLDMNRAFQRALKAAQVPVRYSEGFNPHPRIVFSQPLPLGVEGRCEILDVQLCAPVELSGLAARVSGGLPQGLRVVAAAPPQYDMKQIAWAGYETLLPAGLEEDFLRFWQRDSIPVQKKSKRTVREIDLKQLALRLSASAAGAYTAIRYMLPCASDGAVGPLQMEQAFSEFLGRAIPAAHARTGFYTEDLTPFFAGER